MSKSSLYLLQQYIVSSRDNPGCVYTGLNRMLKNRQFTSFIMKNEEAST